MLTGDMLTLPNAISFCKGPLKCSVSEILATHSLWVLNPGTTHKESPHFFSVLPGDWVDYNCSQLCFSPWVINFYWKMLGFVTDFNGISLRPLSESLLFAASLIFMWYIWKLSIIMLPLKWEIDKLLSLRACWVQIGSLRSQVNVCQARLLLSSLCLIPKLKFTCMIVLHLTVSLFVFVWNLWQQKKAGILYDLWITSFVSASENLKRLGIQCYAECYLQVLWPEETIMIIYFDLLQAMKYLLKFL